jgi:hypothetical protein
MKAAVMTAFREPLEVRTSGFHVITSWKSAVVPA